MSRARGSEDGFDAWGCVGPILLGLSAFGLVVLVVVIIRAV